MSKAEERAMQYCCTKCANNKLNCGIKLLSHGRDCIKCSNYIEGYHQAEKDLLANKHEKSWRLDGKLWKGIKDVEEASYQYTYDASNDWAYDIPTWDDVQDAFKAGSEWKEDFALTIEDIKTIDRLLNKCVDCSNPYQEVLKQFKVQKGK